MTATALHLTGPILVSAEEVREQAWVVEGRLTFDRPSAPGTDLQTILGWVLPGLADAHCHIGLGAHGAVDAETAEAQALTDRAAGTLLIRDAGSPLDTRWVDERDDLPKIIRAGRHIGRTRRYLPNVAHEIEPDQLVSRVRAEARAGDGWVKLVGDWIDRTIGDLATCWPRDVLTEAIAAAHEEGARVTAHCFGEESLRDFAAADTDCIEHACGLQPDTIAAFASQGIAIVPTMVNIAKLPSMAEPAREKYPVFRRHLLDLHRRRLETFAAAHDAGIPIYAGTDAGGGIAHGLIAEEVVELTGAGLSTIEALSAATWGARAWLGRPGLDEGEDADLLVLADDPRAGLEALKHPRAIVLRGTVVG